MSELNESTEHPNQLHQIQLYDHIIGSLIHYQVLKLHVHFHHCMTMHFAKVADSPEKFYFAKLSIEMSTRQGRPSAIVAGHMLDILVQTTRRSWGSRKKSGSHKSRKMT